jgi:hypothetical protein
MSKTDCRQQSNSHQSKCRQNLKMKVTLLKSKKDGKRPLSWPPCRLARKARLVGEPHVGSKYSQQHGTQRFFESSIKRLFNVYKTEKETLTIRHWTTQSSLNDAYAKWKVTLYQEAVQSLQNKKRKRAILQQHMCFVQTSRTAHLDRNDNQKTIEDENCWRFWLHKSSSWLKREIQK